jgi:hypothetical protein
MRSLLLAAALFAVPVAPALSQTSAQNVPQNVPMGSYGCWTYTQQRPDIAFSVTGAGAYSDVRGRNGTFSIEGGRIKFSGGALDKQLAVFNGGNPPALSLLGPGGKEAAFCQLTR